MSLSWGWSVHLMGVGHKVLCLLFHMLSFSGMPCSGGVEQTLTDLGERELEAPFLTAQRDVVWDGDL